jgi:sugar lactone lactonase YvrE
MFAHRIVWPLVILALAAPAVARAEVASAKALPEGVEVVAAGLTSPRGFAWSPDGSLYLALAGSGGDTRIEVAAGATFEIGLSSSVATVADGCATPVASGLVSAHWVEPGWVWGAMDVAFLADELYVLVSGAGPSWLSPSSFSGVYRLNDDSTMTLVADVTSWLPDNPPAFIPPDYGSDGSLFDLEAAGDALLLSEAVGGQLLRVTPAGEITSVADLSEGHPVPTGIAVDSEGNAYVGFETTPPWPDGSSKVVKVTPDGTVSDAWTGLTAVTDVAIGPDGTLYAAEMATGNLDTEPYISPGTGRVVRQNGPDGVEDVLTDIDYPVTLGFDPDGALHVAYPAFAPNAGDNQGALLRIDPGTATPISLAGVGVLPATCEGGPVASTDGTAETTPATSADGTAETTPTTSADG